MNGEGNWECYLNATMTSGQPYIAAARGKIGTAGFAGSTSVFWYSHSHVATTTVTADVGGIIILHPAVNLLIENPPTTSSSSSSSLTTTGSTTFGSASNPTASLTEAGEELAEAAFSLFGFGVAASVGVLAALALAGVSMIAIAFLLVKRSRRKRKMRNDAAAVRVRQAYAAPAPATSQPTTAYQPFYQSYSSYEEVPQGPYGQGGT